ncbi:DUF4118 domain-containing protein [Erythrobacter sp. 3-20A1M]|uniref:histidine kinase dimerization/phosphoacceptor domain -containing protein n=1 Tax=Erythrobacter sp. 3-20A1M TaxID=2653850 RepID=UPI001BFC5330|nr:histidine kinase dimerization/phosphoacceptor domain -containing protein [Erythrobacter sp. 3-20A1M]QWC55794.1 DUF4118 domain-containing protein [Erythrobacter sp. 3-20A1M]
MHRLAQFDVSRQFQTRRGKKAAQYGFGVMCAGAMIGVRTTVDLIAPSSGPFALIYPTVLLATLYGHLRAGVTAAILTFLWAWYFVLPAPSSFTFTNPTDPGRVVLNAVCCLIVMCFAEAFRRAAHGSLKEIQRSADRRLTLLAELEHRTKNNFALVASMLEFQKRRLSDITLHRPIDDAVGRIRTFADAYSNLAYEQAEHSDVEMELYLDALMNRLEKAAVPSHVRLYREIEPVTLPRETAVAIGLYLNEALSNCLKYAFPDGRSGTIGVFFHVTEGEWRLTVDDNGVGHGAVSDGSGGLGTSLMAAFAQQAGGTHEAAPIVGGFRASLSSSRVAATDTATAR